MAHSDSSASSTDLLQDLHRRRVLQRAAATAVTTAAVAALGTAVSSTPANAQTATDIAVINFALNLEYLEAEFYLRAVTGQGVPASLTSGVANAGNSAAGGVVNALTGGNALVPWSTTAVAYWAQQIANDELAHIRYLRSIAGAAAIAEPAIDLTNGFNTLSQSAGLGATFNPFSGEIAFLVGAYSLSDVGVSAYAGSAGLLSPAVVPGAAGILATEGYHMGAIRARLSEIGGGTVSDQISTLRSKLSGIGDLGILNPGNPFTIVNDDVNGLITRRAPQQVLAIVYGGGTTGGLFFPNGVNGSITTAAAA